jgi:hypothetical protein
MRSARSESCGSSPVGPLLYETLTFPPPWVPAMVVMFTLTSW